MIVFGDTRRAYNIIWNAWGSYKYEPFYKSMDFKGNVNLYLNTIIGLSYKYYGKSFLEELFDLWKDDENANRYDNLAWLILESSVYEKELKSRPVLMEIRRDEAENFLDLSNDLARKKIALWDHFVYSMIYKRKAEILERKFFLTKKENELYKILSPGEFLEKEILKERLLNAFVVFFKFSLNKKHKLKIKLPFKIKNLSKEASGFTVERTSSLDVSGKKQSTGRGLLKSSKNDNREYIERVFGKSIFDKNTELDIERHLSCDINEGLHLYFTKREESNLSKNRNILSQIDSIKSQILDNKEYFVQNKLLVDSGIRKLQRKFSSTLILSKRDEEILNRYGILDGTLAWKGKILSDEKIFRNFTYKQSPNFSVDILMDGSASRLFDVNLHASQVYMLSESLRKSGIPLRVMSFSTLYSYTVINILKDYDDKNSKGIFNYFAAGYNRDGFALRGVKFLLDQKKSKKLLIIVTDANPDDLRYNSKIKADYSVIGPDDTAKEIFKLKNSGIEICALITGRKENLENAKKIYGDYAYIENLENITSLGADYIRKKIFKLIYKS